MVCKIEFKTPRITWETKYKFSVELQLCAKVSLTDLESTMKGNTLSLKLQGSRKLTLIDLELHGSWNTSSFKRQV